MCRSIKTSYNFDPPATEEELQAAALQFVRKLSGFQKPSMANEAAFNQAFADISLASRKLVDGLSTNAKTKNREDEAKKSYRRYAARRQS